MSSSRWTLMCVVSRLLTWPENRAKPTNFEKERSLSAIEGGEGREKGER